MSSCSPSSDSEFQDSLLDSLASRFRRQLDLGRSPAIEDYLQGFSEPLRTALFSLLIKEEFGYQQSHGRSVPLQEFLSRFPEYKALIATALGESSATTLNEDHSTVIYTRQKLGRFDRFELLEEIGQGGFGTVFRAHDTQLDRMVAIKFPRAERLTGEFRERFMREARTAAQLRHPYIASVYDVVETDDTVGLVSNFIYGMTLTEWMRRRRLTIDESVELVRHIARSVQAAHQLGIVHRDIKPDNILLDVEGKPHITDFGLAKRQGMEETLTLDGQVIGTLSYMAPEQAEGRINAHDFRTDTYALGVLLYELLSGTRPFVGQLKKVLHEIQFRVPKSVGEWNTQVPVDLQTICHKAIAKLPADRYQTADALAEDLERYQRGAVVVAKPLTIWQRSWRKCRLNPGAVIATAITFILITTSMFFAVNILPQRADRTVEAAASVTTPVVPTHPEGPLPFTMNLGWDGMVEKLTFTKERPISLLNIKPRPVIFASEREENFFAFPDERKRYVVKSDSTSFFVWPIVQPESFRWTSRVIMNEAIHHAGFLWNLRQSKSKDGELGYAADAVTWRNDSKNKRWRVHWETLFLEGLPPSEVYVAHRALKTSKSVAYDEVSSDVVDLQVQRGVLKELFVFGHPIDLQHQFTDLELLHRCTIGFTMSDGELMLSESLIREENLQ